MNNDVQHKEVLGVEERLTGSPRSKQDAPLWVRCLDDLIPFQGIAPQSMGFQVFCHLPVEDTTMVDLT